MKNLLRPQQTSPVGSIGSENVQQRSVYPSIPQASGQLPNSTVPQQPQFYQQPFNHHTSQQQPLHQLQQNPQHSLQTNRPPLPTSTAAADQNLNVPHFHLNVSGKPSSRASSSSGGNVSTVQSTGAGSIGGTQQAGSTGTKQEQRLTHEQVSTINMHYITDCKYK